MRLLDRDLLTIKYVNLFSQLTSQHIQSLVFPDVQSMNPLYRCLKRLQADDYLAPIERRLIGGTKGGGSQYVWQLGVAGWRMCREGRYLPARSIRFHTLAVADLFVALVNLEREGRLVIRHYVTEPDNHLVIKHGGTEYFVKPDLTVEISRPDGTHVLPIMFEIDQGSQQQRVIIEKLTRYWGAYQNSDEAVMSSDLIIVFVAIDERRAAELRLILARGNEEQRRIFRVHTLESFLAQFN
jgi:hypothetical protein